MPTDTVLYALADSGVATITLNDPDTRNALSAELLLGLTEAFEHARWIEASSGGLGKMIKDSGIPVKQVAALLQVDLPRALAVIRGQVPVIAEQAESLAPALGLDSQRILAANPAPPAELAAYLDQPQWRAQVRRLAQQNDQSETRAWYDAAFGTWGLAARQTGGTSQPPAWEERLKRFFAMSLRGTA